MKKKLAMGLAAVLILTALSGCGQKATINEETQSENGGKTQVTDYQDKKDNLKKTEEKETETKETEASETEETVESSQVQGGIPFYEEIYSGLLDEYYDQIVSTYLGEDMYANDLFGGLGIAESASMTDSLEDALKCVGYSICDINGDDVLELLVGSATEQDGIVQGDVIFGVYTCIADEPAGVIDGWYRSSYRPTADGGFIYSGSGSAVHSMLGKCFVAQNAAELVWESYYFTEFIDEMDTELGWFYNTTGEWEVKASELLDITWDDFYQIEEELYGQIEPMDMMTFYDYRVPDESLLENSAAGMAVEAAWADEVLAADAVYDEFVADTADFAANVVFIADERVTEFKVLYLEFQDIEEDGTLIFAETELYAQEELIWDDPLVVKLAVYGTIPTYGISYIDGYGNLRKYAVSISGYDGSVELVEFRS